MSSTSIRPWRSPSQMQTWVPTSYRSSYLRQSKYGCLTCKARKVRCDEIHPTCRRCTNSGFVCEGYTNTRPASPAHESAGSSQSWATFSVTPEIPPATSSPDRSIQQRLINFLSSTDVAYVGREALNGIIRTTPQLAPSSLTAIPALEILVQRDTSDVLNDPESRLKVDTAYGQAIPLFVDEIRQDSADFGTVFITGIILITIELLQRRRQDAWKHLLGSRQSLRSATSVDFRSDDVHFLYRIYDLQTMIYSDGIRPPMIEPQDQSGLEKITADSLSFRDLERCVVTVLHGAHALISRVHYSDVMDLLPEESQAEEKTCLTNILLVQQLIDHKLNAEPLLETHEESAYLILRSLCLMTIMTLEQLRSRDEMVWDQYAEDFQFVIEAAETIQSRSRVPSQSHGHLHLTLQLGLASPLTLAALKYRHPLWRRRAAACLRLAGIEGPFIGRQLAAMVERCMEIEESGSRQPSTPTIEPSSSATRIDVRLPTDEKRLAHCWTDDDNGNADQTSWPGTAKGSTLVTFLARRLPERALAAKVLVSSTFKMREEYRSIQDRTVDTTIWQVWTETIQFNS